jgi:hypothetical protein
MASPITWRIAQYLKDFALGQDSAGATTTGALPRLSLEGAVQLL